MAGVLVDLHTHTRASDGTLAPRDLVAAARAAGVGVLGVTDHDGMGGCAEAVAAGAELGVEVVPGIELSVRFAAGSFHLLGWFRDATPPGLFEQMARLGENRERRNRQIIANLCDLGVPITWEDAAKHTGDRMARPHIAKALVEAGWCSEVQEAFDRYLADDAPAFVPVGAVEPDEAIALVKDAGGVASVAHPGTLRRDPAALDALVGRLAAAGLDAVEVHRGDHAPEVQAEYAALAQRHGLLVSGGSDYHGPELEGRGRLLGATGAPGLDEAAARALLDRRR